MTLFKCKMCGGSLEVTEGMTVCECDYCGTSQTLPQTHNEVTTNLFNRANNLRMKCEFDKAQEIYEKIVASNSTEAEAYWGIVLCKYGIEYVEDPVTCTKIPTCHRTQLESVQTDVDYQSALQYADALQCSLYAKEAQTIDQLQKNILAIVQQEKPFDVFICYKETDEDGRRTADSVIANDIYHQLTQESLKVFYAAITLEDKLGQAYEPYIFAALNSAKVMLVIGTKPEYFSAVWVKNEWSRYLKIMKNDRSKLLIPCYKDMDAYDLPEEFAHLQAQDMSKIGFINDVIRGIKKVCSKGIDTVSSAAIPMHKEAQVSIDSLLKRAAIFLEDEEWSNANQYYDRVLDIQPQCAEAYLGKMMSELPIRQSQLTSAGVDYSQNQNFKKACQYADEAFLKRIQYCCSQNQYSIAMQHMSTAQTSEQFLAAADLFSLVRGFSDASSKEVACRERADSITITSDYNRACALQRKDTIHDLNEAIRLFEKHSSYQDCSLRVHQCEQRISEIKASELAKKQEQERVQAARALAEKKRKRRRTIIRSIVFTALVCVIGGGLLWTKVIRPKQQYQEAMSFYENAEYSQAESIFAELGEYKDTSSWSSMSKIQIRLQEAQHHIDSGDLDGALQILESIASDYDLNQEMTTLKDEMIVEAKYQTAESLYRAESYSDAKDIYVELGAYKDCSQKAAEVQHCIYLNAKVGDVVDFGTHKWRVLDRTANKLLIITDDVVDERPYNDTLEEVTWETCTLRDYLNNEFIDQFSEKEKSMMIETLVHTPDNNYYGDSISGGNDTVDKVFLLSADEVKQYFPGKYPNKENSTVIIEGTHKNYEYWLRSPGSKSTLQACSVLYPAEYYGFDDYGICWWSSSQEDVSSFLYVRPAIWISVE